MYRRIVKSERILTKLRVLDYEYIVMDIAVGCYAYGNMFWCL